MGNFLTLKDLIERRYRGLPLTEALAGIDRDALAGDLDVNGERDGSREKIDELKLIDNCVTGHGTLEPRSRKSRLRNDRPPLFIGDAYISVPRLAPPPVVWANLRFREVNGATQAVSRAEEKATPKSKHRNALKRGNPANFIKEHWARGHFVGKTDSAIESEVRGHSLFETLPDWIKKAHKKTFGRAASFSLLS